MNEDIVLKTYQKVVFDKEAHEGLLRGAEVLYNAVKTTMGPSGHSVIIDQYNKAPMITKDGVTVAKSINLEGRLESMGAELIKEVAGKTNDLAGDGTTTATVLAYSMLYKGIQLIASGRSSIEIKRGMDFAAQKATELLQEYRVDIKDKNEIISVGTISSNGDKELGVLIADAIEKVGRDGIITIEPAKSVKTSLEIVEGMQIPNGYISPFFITNSDKANCEFENPYILLTSNKISSLADIIPTLEFVADSNRPLLIVADDVEGEALHTLIVNKVKGILNVCAIKAPSYGEHRASIMDDLSIVTNAEVIGATSATSLKKVDRGHLGECKRVIVGRNATTFVGDSSGERKEEIQKRVSDLRSVLENDKTLDDLRIHRYRDRLAKLSGGVAVIKVGGSTEVEIKERKDRVEDAVNATTAATQEGILPGGGTALFYIAQLLKKEYEALQNDNKYLLEGDTGVTDDFIEGIKLIVYACESPMRTIVENTGQSADVYSNLLKQKFEKSLENLRMARIGTKETIWSIPEEYEQLGGSLSLERQFCHGINAATKKYTDLIEEGIIDPAKVTRYALEHACSVVGLMLTCNSVIVNDKEEEL